jgi:hypothetical protein
MYKHRVQRKGREGRKAHYSQYVISTKGAMARLDISIQKQLSSATFALLALKQILFVSVIMQCTDELWSVL